MNAERSDLSGTARRRLRKLGRACPALLRVGKAGLTPPVTEQVDALLADRELVKLRVLPSARVSCRELAEKLGTALGATVVSIVGLTVLLYRPNVDLAAEKRVNLK